MNFSQALGQIDERYIQEALDYRVPAKTRRRPRLWAALAAAVLLIGVCVAAEIWGTQVVDMFTSRSAPGSDFTESGYDLIANVEKFPIKDFSSELQGVGAEIQEQFASYELWSSWYPGDWQKSFDTPQEVADFIGLAGLEVLDWDLTPTRITLNVDGTDQGKINSVVWETDYVDGGVRCQAFVRIYTENTEGDVILATRTTEEETFGQTYYTAKSGKTCHIITASTLESGYMSLDGYLVEDGVLYRLYIAYLEKDADRAWERMEQWADMF